MIALSDDEGNEANAVNERKTKIDVGIETVNETGTGSTTETTGTAAGSVRRTGKNPTTPPWKIELNESVVAMEQKTRPFHLAVLTALVVGTVPASQTVGMVGDPPDVLVILGTNSRNPANVVKNLCGLKALLGIGYKSLPFKLPSLNSRS